MDINKAALIEKILNKDPLTDLSIIEKATLRNCKHECLQKYMNSLPKLLQTINWSNKLDVIEVYNLNANFFFKSKFISFRLDLRSDHRMDSTSACGRYRTTQL